MQQQGVPEGTPTFKLVLVGDGGNKNDGHLDADIGMKLMKKMGFKEGQGLGARASGRTEPIAVHRRPEKVGLGADSIDMPSLIDKKGKKKKGKATDDPFHVTEHNFKHKKGSKIKGQAKPSVPLKAFDAAQNQQASQEFREMAAKSDAELFELIRPLEVPGRHLHMSPDDLQAPLFAGNPKWIRLVEDMNVAVSVKLAALQAQKRKLLAERDAFQKQLLSITPAHEMTVEQLLILARDNEPEFSSKMQQMPLDSPTLTALLSLIPDQMARRDLFETILLPRLLSGYWGGEREIPVDILTHDTQATDGNESMTITNNGIALDFERVILCLKAWKLPPRLLGHFSDFLSIPDGDLEAFLPLFGEDCQNTVLSRYCEHLSKEHLLRQDSLSLDFLVTKMKACKAKLSESHFRHALQKVFQPALTSVLSESMHIDPHGQADLSSLEAVLALRKVIHVPFILRQSLYPKLLHSTRKWLAELQDQQSAEDDFNHYSAMAAWYEAWKSILSNNLEGDMSWKEEALRPILVLIAQHLDSINK